MTLLGLQFRVGDIFLTIEFDRFVPTTGLPFALQGNKRSHDTGKRHVRDLKPVRAGFAYIPFVSSTKEPGPSRNVESRDSRFLNPFRTAVPFRGQTTQISSSLSPQNGTAVLKRLRWARAPCLHRACQENE